jgi:hypothetical protein
VKDIKFSAILPPVQAAIKSDGQGGYRIQLDIPEEDRMQVYQLNELKGMVFEVTVKLPQQDKGGR